MRWYGIGMVKTSFAPTENNRARYAERLENYLDAIRQGWAADGVETRSQKAVDRLHEIRQEFASIDGYDWMEPDRAMSTLSMAGIVDLDRLDTLLAYRTLWGLTAKEYRVHLARALGTTETHIRAQFNGAIYNDGESSRRDLTEEPTALYLHYDENGTLLYVGITCDQEGRERTHSNDSPWWKYATGHEYTWYKDRPSAEAAEQKAIVECEPIFNKSHNTYDLMRARQTDYLFSRIVA